jgi:cyclohexadienyl dehydratase
MGIRGFLTCLVLAFAAAATAAEPGVLRVGSSGDYAPFSSVRMEGTEYQGFDAALARAYAEERGLTLQWVPFTWPQLLHDFAAGSFDVAMSGVTVRPRRSVAGRFTVPLVESGAVVLVREPTHASSLDDVDRRGMRLAVNAGGHLERAARARFSRATLIFIPENAGVLRALLRFTVDAVVTDTFEAPSWERQIEKSRRFGPFTHDRKAYLVHPDRPELAADLDAWLLAREADGSLRALRQRYFEGTTTRPTATPLEALVAAMDERLALMPMVAAAKRRDVLPIAAPRREAEVVKAGLAGVAAAAARTKRAGPPEEVVHAFFQAQIESAKDVQLAAVRDPDFEPEAPVPDLEAELRPALLRIGARIALLLVALPEDLPAARVSRACRDGLRAPWLSDASRRTLTAALAKLAQAPRIPPKAEP